MVSDGQLCGFTLMIHNYKYTTPNTNKPSLPCNMLPFFYFTPSRKPDRHQVIAADDAEHAASPLGLYTLVWGAVLEKFRSQIEKHGSR